MAFFLRRDHRVFKAPIPCLELIRELGIEGELQKADSRAPRYVYLHGHLRKIPMSPQALLTSSLLAPGSRWKIASEAFKRSKPPSEEETVASFVRRKFGHEILEYLVAPFVSGVYAGDPEQLSLKAAFPSLDEWEREYGSVLRGAMKSRPAKSKGAAAHFAVFVPARSGDVTGSDGRQARRASANWNDCARYSA